MQTPKSTINDKLYTTTHPSLSKTSQPNNAKTQLNSYQIGQILKGEIIDLAHQEIKILLSNGQLLKGSLATSIPLSISDTADFIVTDNQNSKLVLKLLSNAPTSTLSTTIDKALEEANLVKTERNVSVVNELLKQQMSIDKNTIQTVLRQASLFKNASLETIVLMNKHQLPLTDVNTTQFEAYRNFEHQLFTQVKSLTSSLLTSMSSSTPEEANQLHQAILKLALPELSENVAPKQLVDLIQSLSAQDNLTIAMPGQEQVNRNSTNIYELPSQTEVPLPQVETVQTPDKNLSQAEILQAADKNLSQAENLHTTDKNLSQAETLHTADKNLSQAEIPQAIEKFLSQPSTKLLSSPQYQNILENLILKTFTLSTEQLLESGGISRFYEQVEDKANELKQLFTQLEAVNTENKFQTTTTIIDKLTDSIDFMKVMNQFFGYVQLPMKLPHQYNNSELFVYTNKKQLLDGNKNISVLLHLDMEHLGPIDFHLSLFQQQVTAKVSLLHEDSLPLLIQNLPQLQQSLEAKGYSFSYELRQIDEEINVIKSYFDEDSSDLVMKHYTFDKRA